MRALIAVALLLPTIAFAQQGQVPYIETLDVRVHSIDVVVTDAKGHAVPGLTRNDFEVLENGTPQEITNFSAYGTTRPRTSATAEQAATPNEVVGNDQPQREPRKFIFFIDEISLQASTAKMLRAQLDHLLDTTMEAGDEGLIVRPAEEKKLALPFTKDKEQLRRALATTIRGEKWRAVTPIERERRRLAIENEGASPRAKRLAARRYAGIVRARVQQRLGQLNAIINAAAEVPGRKVLVLVTESLPMEPGMEAFYALHQYAKGTKAEDLENGAFADWSGLADSTSVDWVNLSPLVEEIARTAAAAGITIYPLQAEYGAGVFAPSTGVETRAEQTSDRRNDTPVMGEVSTQALLPVVNTENTIRRLADITGGTWRRGGMNIDDLLNEIAGDIQNYYSLGYRAGDAVDQARKIEVRVKGRSGLRVRTRQEVIRKSPEREMTDRVVAALIEPSVPGELAIRVESKIVRVARDAATAEVYVAARVPLGQLTFLPDGDRYKARFSVHYAATGEQADFVSGMAGTQVIDVPAAEFEHAKSGYYTYVVPLTLRLSTYSVALGVLDSVSHLSGIGKIAVTAGR